MVSAPINSSTNCSHILRQCEVIKTSIIGKSLEATNVLSPEFISRQKLERLYKSLLVCDVQFALDRKLELELWNNAFKGHIDSLRQKVKASKNNEKSEVQARLSLFLDAASGFYIDLLQEFCDVHNLDLPYHGKSSQLGILSENTSAKTDVKPKLNVCLYVCQDCLVHLGDVARYRNDLTQADIFYNLSSKLLPGNGQPYNQLAILATSRGDQLQSIFFYCKSIIVHNQFPAAASNLQKTFAQICAKFNFNILAKSNGVSKSECLDLFLQFHGGVHLMQDVSKLAGLKEKVLQDFKDNLSEMSDMELIFVAGICIFNLFKHMPNDEHEKSIPEEDEEEGVWELVLTFTIQLLQLLLDFTIGTMSGDATSLEDLRCLPSIKVLFDWISSGSTSIRLFERDPFQANPELYYQLVVFGNELQRSCTKREKSVVPLIEDRQLHGFVPLRRTHKRYDFKVQPVQLTAQKIWSIRVSRILCFLDWFTQQHEPSKFMTKDENDSHSDYICLLAPSAGFNNSVTAPEAEGTDNIAKELFEAIPSIENKMNLEPRTKSPFSETRSLFRTQSEEHGMRNIPAVQSPVQPYSLFQDSVWGSVSLTTTADGSIEQVGSPILPMNLYPSKSVGEMKQTSKPPPRKVNAAVQSFQAYQQKAGIVLQKQQQQQQQVHRQTPPQALLNSTKQQQKPMNPLKPPTQLQQQVALNISNQQQVTNQQQLTQGQIPLAGIQKPLDGFNGFPPLLTNHNSSHDQLSNQNAVHSQLSNQLAMLHLTTNTTSDPLAASTISHSTSPLSSAHRYSPQNRTVSPHNGYAVPGAVTAVTAHAAFGAIGQTAAQVIPSSTARSPATENSAGGGYNGDARQQNANVGRSIWSSNFALGQGTLSPLEQLLQDQRRHARPK